MNTSQKLALPKRIFKPGTEPIGLERVNKCSNLKLVRKVKDLLGQEDFKTLENSFLSPIIKLGQEENINFSGKLVHHLLQRRILTTKQELWFTFGEQPMRFSLREFFLTTGLPCTRVVAKPSSTGNRKKIKYSWMKGGGVQLKELISILKNGESTMSSDEKVRIGATILVEGILLAQYASKRIPKERLLRASDFDEYCSYHWGKCAYDTLVDGVKKLTAGHLSREQYELSGFPLAIQLWALSSVHQLGIVFGKRAPVSTTDGPLCLKWTHTWTPKLVEVASIAQLDKVEVKCIIGDPKLYNNLVEEEAVDVEFRKVIGLVEKGYRIKTSDWVKGYIDVLVASREIENPFCPLESDEYSEKLDKLTKLATLLQKKVQSLEKVVWIQENGEQGKHTQDKEVVEEDTTIDSIKKKKRTRETIEEEEDKEERNNDGGDTSNKDTTIGNITSNKKQKLARETTEDIGDKVEEEEEEIEGDKNNMVLPLSQVHQNLGDGKKKAVVLTYKRHKRAREDDKRTMDCCQSQDDNITSAQRIKSGKKCGDVVENTDGGGDAYGGLEVDYNVSGLAQKLTYGAETVATPEIEQMRENNDKNNSSDPCNGAAEKEEEDYGIDDERLKQRKLAIEELALKLEARMLKVENNLAKRKMSKNHTKTPVSA